MKRLAIYVTGKIRVEGREWETEDGIMNSLDILNIQDRESVSMSLEDGRLLIRALETLLKEMEA